MMGIADRETRVVADDALEVRLWLRLASCVDIFERELRRRLATYGVSLARFEVLGQLDRYADGLSMRQLSDRLMVSKGNTSALIARMEEEGLLERATHAEDRRIQVIRLSGRGRTVFNSVKSPHHGILRTLMTGVDRARLAALYNDLSILKTSANKNKNSHFSLPHRQKGFEKAEKAKQRVNRR